ncbi:hypothetical protein AD006_29620 (plasmid) [Pseudonocardia sp. EC080610-09]|nr:hypothetical protein AD006_29620 [Pseudonocardia sp. EC080610-09]ALL85621.1 hypothetical protein AD017_31630 [Pseudonocardia sp. EC080619-01]
MHSTGWPDTFLIVSSCSAECAQLNFPQFVFRCYVAALWQEQLLDGSRCCGLAAPMAAVSAPLLWAS